MQNIFCTLAIGGQHAEFARYLAADLGVYKVAFVVVTDVPRAFRSFSSVHVVEHHPERFSYHDKRIALREALKLGETAVFVDADTAIWFGADRRVVGKALTYSFPPGLHAGKLYPEDIYSFPHIENLAREWGLNFNRNVISYWEGLFALTRQDVLDKFFAIWDRFAEEAQQRGYNGAGEGACFGIAAEASGLQRHYTTYMMQSMLPYVLWHTRLGFNRRKLYHLKFGIKEMFNGNINIRQHCWAC
ncbi:MAG: hypothetical protein ACLQVY_01185 [Limisphaerales bacterium]